MLTVLAAAAFFPMAEGVYKGHARCHDRAGQELVYDQVLELKGTTVTTTIVSDQGNEVFVKTAAFDAQGFFVWSGPEVAKGEGYCTPAGLCHWDMTFAPRGQTPFDGEDTLVVKDGKLVVVGSVAFGGTKYVCEEVYERARPQQLPVNNTK